MIDLCCKMILVGVRGRILLWPRGIVKVGECQKELFTRRKRNAFQVILNFLTAGRYINQRR